MVMMALAPLPLFHCGRVHISAIGHSTTTRNLDWKFCSACVAQWWCVDCFGKLQHIKYYFNCHGWNYIYIYFIFIKLDVNISWINILLQFSVHIHTHSVLSEHHACDMMMVMMMIMTMLMMTMLLMRGDGWTAWVYRIQPAAPPLFALDWNSCNFDSKNRSIIKC